MCVTVCVRGAVCAEREAVCVRGGAVQQHPSLNLAPLSKPIVFVFVQITSKEFEKVKEATGFSNTVEMLDNVNKGEVCISSTT